ncbi:sulfite exporter TauE/SafE family protein [Pseudanabaena sp. PCC 6802]|uniref:sulfite exporter TauE/SafE family protein n=1 Tax=Pseudanabaena sp. PCC 6802 TaxID=118173 RepID=UPI00034A4122|nr:sulfite exporter TauE/SafE family protein [Pseudanabaena sp. PCC 6802]
MRNIQSFAWGALVGVLGGLIGLGGAEFRLPVLVSIFNYRTLQAIIINLIVSLVTVTFSFVVVLIGHNLIFSLGSFQLPSLLRISFGLVAGIIIGIFSSMLGVAGGELIIPTIILLFAVDIKLAGSLSLAIGIPTIVMGLFKYRSQQRLKEVKSEQGFIGSMASGSILGAFIGSSLLRYVSSSLLYLILGTILLLSALKLAKHKPSENRYNGS